MTGEVITQQTTQTTVISLAASIASNAFNPSTDCTSISSTQTAKYPWASGVLTGSFSTSISANSALVNIYRRDLNIDGTADAPQPQSAAPAYSQLFVGACQIPPLTAGSISVSIPLLGIPLPFGSQCEFYMENKTNATMLSGFVFKVTPETYNAA